MMIHNAKELAMIAKNNRKKQKISQSDIGDLVGLKQTTVSAFENKPETTKLETLFRILSAANLEMHVYPINTSRNQDDWKEEW